MTIGYAVADQQGVDIKTVSETERAAKVNYLVARCGVMVLNTWGDQTINLWFEKISKSKETQVVQVDVTVVKGE